MRDRTSGPVRLAKVIAAAVLLVATSLPIIIVGGVSSAETHTEVVSEDPTGVVADGYVVESRFYTQPFCTAVNPAGGTYSCSVTVEEISEVDGGFAFVVSGEATDDGGAVVGRATLGYTVLAPLQAPYDQFLSLGSDYGCAGGLGVAHCWGSVGLPKPISVKPFSAIDDAGYLATGGRATCALRNNGSITCVRNDANDGSTSYFQDPITFDGPYAWVTEWSAGFCAVHVDGYTACYDPYADPFSPPDPTSETVIEELAGAFPVEGSESVVCGVIDDANQADQVVCTGSGFPDGVNLPSATTEVHGMDIGGVNSGRDRLPSDHRGCAIDAEGIVRCWGNAGNGDLGVPTDDVPFDAELGTRFALEPVMVATDVRFTRIAMTDAYRPDARSWTCGIGVDRFVYCWGDDFGQSSGDHVPTRIDGIAWAFDIAVGDGFGCARDIGGRIMCWGENEKGQLGNGTLVSPDSPVEVLVNRDELGPTISATTDRETNDAAWFDGPVTFSFTCEDESGVARCPEPQTFSFESDRILVVAEAYDIFDNMSRFETITRIDSTDPEVAFVGAQASYDLSDQIDITCTFSDSLSGVATSECDELQIAGRDLGPGVYTLAASAVDVAGNQASASVTFEVVASDVTGPSIVANFDPAANSAGWWNGAVTVTFDCDDDESEVATCPELVIFDAEGADQSGIVTATDSVGNESELVVDGINVDLTEPVLTFTGAADRYELGDEINIGCVAADALSGIAASICPGLVASAADLGLGLHTLEASAVDLAGNEASASITFEIVDDNSEETLRALVDEYLDNHAGTPGMNGLRRALQAKLDRGTYKGFISLVKARCCAPRPGKVFTASEAETLVNLATALLFAAPQSR